MDRKWFWVIVAFVIIILAFVFSIYTFNIKNHGGILLSPKPPSNSPSCEYISNPISRVITESCNSACEAKFAGNSEAIQNCKNRVAGLTSVSSCGNPNQACKDRHSNQNPGYVCKIIGTPESFEIWYDCEICDFWTIIMFSGCKCTVAED